MTSPESLASDAPFPGAHSQVPGARDTHQNREPTNRATTLPLEASAVAWERGWVVRLAVRAESVQVDKQVVVYERAVVRRRETEELATLGASIRREELSVDSEGDARVSTVQHRDDHRPM